MEDSDSGQTSRTSDPLRRRIDRLEAVGRLAARLSEASREEEIFESALDALADCIAPDRMSILLFDADGVMTFRAWRRLSEPYRTAVTGHTPWKPGARGVEPLITTDVRSDPGLASYLDVFEREGIRALAFIPLSAREGVIGKFMLYYDEPHPFGEDELAFAQVIARHVALGIGRLRDEDRIQRERNFLEGAIRNLPVAVAIAEAPSGKIILTNQLRRELWGEAIAAPSSIADYDQWQAYSTEGRRYRPEEWPIARTLRTGDEIRDEELELEQPDGSRRSILLSSNPIRDAEGRLIAAIGVASDITTSRKTEIANRFLAEAGRELVSSLDWKQTLSSVANLAVTRLADWCIVDLLDDSGVIRRLAVAHRDPEKVRWAEEIRRRYPVEPNASSGVPNVIRTGKAELYEEIPDEVLQGAAADAGHLEILRKAGLRSAMIVPLIVRERTLGSITFISSDSQRRYDATDLALAEELARRAALAIDNATLYANAQQAGARAATLQKIAESLSEAATPEQIASVILTHGIQALEAIGGSIALLDDTGSSLEILGAVGFSKAMLRHSTFPLTAARPLAGAVRNRALLLFSSREELFAAYPEMKEAVAQEHRAVAAVPLIVGSQVLGGMALTFGEKREFSPADRDLILTIARQCAQAMDRARLYESERAARAEAESANRAKDEFLATLSHELRTPMTATLGWSRMLTMSPPDEETLNVAAESIYRSALAQARIVDDLLDVSRIITGKMRVESRAVDLEPIANEALDSVRAAAEAKSIQLSIEVQRPLGLIAGDADRLQQVCWNLLSNAIKFTQAGGRVDLTLRHDEHAVELSVRDSGTGIVPDLLPHVFERFRQGESGSSRSIGGLGLGLSIVKHLVELHGGEATASSDGPGKGSTFTIRFPRLDEGPEERRAHTAPFASDHSLDERRLLVVDDDADSLRIVQAILERYGATVETAESVSEALVRIDQNPPDLILSDLAMPGSDGFEFIEKVRSRPGTNRVPAIAVSAYGRPEDQERSLRAGFDTYLRKPVEPEVLIAAVAAALRRHAR